MEDIIGFLIFIVIVAVSIIGKIKQDRKSAEEDADRPVRPMSMEELPEATRRMLFGDRDGDIIIARPKHAEPAKDEWVPVTQIENPPPGRQVAYERPVTAPPPPAPQRPQPVRPVPTQTVQRQYPQPQKPPHPAPRQSQARPPQRPAPRQPVPQQRRQAPPQTTRTVKPPAAQEITLQPSRNASAKNVLTLMKSRQGLSQGILLREVLGPPRAFDL